jgi:hypothetical protein
MIVIVALLAYRADSNFGFVVFALVGAAITMVSYGMGPYETITFGIIFILAAIWSIFAKTPKNLTLILVVSALLFIFIGLSSPALVGGDYWHWLIGAVALINFLLCIFLAYALATEKLPVF